MAGGAIVGTADTSRIEAPVTVKVRLLVAVQSISQLTSNPRPTSCAPLQLLVESFLVTIQDGWEGKSTALQKSNVGTDSS